MQLWLWKCDCGKETEAIKSNVTTGHTKSCGHLQVEVPKVTSFRHGGCVGKKWHPLYVAYRGMLQRCEDENHEAFKDYGGRGIKVLWKSFVEFRKDMGSSFKEGLTINRINNNGHYEKGNCNWITRALQNLNSRRNVRITLNGKTQTMKEWSDELGISQGAIRMRRERGWSDQQTLTTPLFGSNRRG